VRNKSHSERRQSLSKEELAIFRNYYDSTNLEGGPHEFQHQPKYFTTHFKHPIHRIRTISGDAETQVKFDGLQKSRRFVAFAICYRT
jgi:hypothetical protein